MATQTRCYQDDYLRAARVKSAWVQKRTPELKDNLEIKLRIETVNKGGSMGEIARKKGEEGMI